MKIRTEKDVEKLDQKIKDELGIDVRKYRNQEVVENFVELLVFPEYIFSWTIRPIILSFVAFIVGFFVLDLVHIEYVLYGIFGLVLFLITGVLLGLLFLTWKMKSDMWGIIDYSLNIMKSAVNDINQVSHQVNAENRKDVLGLLFKGVIHIVTIPMLSQVISDKVPLVGGIVNRFVKKLFTLLSDRFSFDEIQLEEEMKKGEESNALQLYSKSIATASTGLNKLLGFTFGVAQFPLKISAGFFSLLLLLFLYLIG